MPVRKGELLIDESFKDIDALFLPFVDGEHKGRGGVPRDFIKYPREMFQPPTELKLTPKSDWSAIIKEKEALNARLSDVRLNALPGGGMIPGLDQGQVGYCWAHSTTHTVMLDRMMRNERYVPLSAYSVAATIKKGADQGGWCGLSAQFGREKGFASQEKWPQGDRNYSKYINDPSVVADMAKYRIIEDWVDLTKPVYLQNLSFDIVATLLLSDIPCAVDFNWWGHSVCALDLVEVEAGSFGIRIWNSWGDKWSDRGMGVLRGTQAIPDGAIATRVTLAA